MIPVMLVDDEPLALLHLQRLISWEKQGFDIVGKASNGARALELIENCRPQVILSDIRMPLMDGLTLCREIRLRYPDMAVILLSAYKDFEYAKQAIRYGVSNYILKHELNQETLSTELAKVREQLSNHQRMRLVRREEHYKALLLGMQSVQETADEENAAGHYTLLILKEDTPLPLLHIVEDDSAPSQGFAGLREHCLKMSFEKLSFVVDIGIDLRHHLVLLEERRLISQRQRHEAIMQCITFLQAYLSGIHGRSYSITYAEEISREHLPQAFRSLSNLVHYTAFRGRGCLLRLGDAPVQKAGPAPDQLEDWFAKLKQGEDPKACIEKMFDAVTQPYWHHEGLRMLCERLAALATKWQREQGAASLPSADTVCWSARDVCDAYTAIFEDLAVRGRKLSRCSKTIQQAAAYVSSNFRKEITLDGLSEELGMSAAYLGQLFKHEVGVTFSQYLTAKRLDEAKKLLSQQSHTVADIAEMVGYSSGQYFSQIFLKKVGCTPHHYRKWREQHV